MSRVSVSIYFSLCLKWQKKQPNTGVNTGNSWEHASQLICRPKMCCRVERQMYYHLHTGQRGIIKQRLPKYSSIFKCFLFVKLKINHSHVHFLVTFYTCDHGGTNMKTHEKKANTQGNCNRLLTCKGLIDLLCLFDWEKNSEDKLVTDWTDRHRQKDGGRQTQSVRF